MRSSREAVQKDLSELNSKNAELARLCADTATAQKQVERESAAHAGFEFDGCCGA